MMLNIDYLIEVIWEHLNLIKVFTKKRGGIIFNFIKFQ
jgi:ribosome-interacting GTPase 1